MSQNTQNETLDKLSQKKPIITTVGVLALGLMGLYAFKTNIGPNSSTLQRVQSSVPGTQFSSINCDLPIKGMCEAVAGQTVVYITKTGKHAFVGHMLDLKNNRDLTEDRMGSLSSFSKALTGITGNTASTNAQAATAPRQTQQRPQEPAQPIDVSLLSEANAIVHNPDATGGTVIVFSDPNCGACNDFYNSMATVKDVKFVEYLMPFLRGSVDKAKQILCSDNPADALHQGFTNQLSPAPATCAHADGIINANLSFAETNGITSTPTIFSSTGKRLVGARSAITIRELSKS